MMVESGGIKSWRAVSYSLCIISISLYCIVCDI